MNTVTLPSGAKVPALGLGTWRMGEDPALAEQEIKVIQLALDSGGRVIDTAEMYGSGRTEELVGRAIAGPRRDAAWLVSKVMPSNASRRNAVAACEQSLHRLGTDRLDLYLLHWRGTVPIEETLEAFIRLQQSGKIRYYGVSNFDLSDMSELWAAPGGSDITTNQLLYNLSRRNIEWDLLPWLRERRVPMMAYSPIERGVLLANPRLREFSKKRSMTPAQVAVGWLLAQKDMIVIPKTSHPKRLRELLAAADRPLTEADLAELDEVFPPPSGPSTLEML